MSFPINDVAKFLQAKFLELSTPYPNLKLYKRNQAASPTVQQDWAKVAIAHRDSTPYIGGNPPKYRRFGSVDITIGCRISATLLEQIQSECTTRFEAKTFTVPVTGGGSVVLHMQGADPLPTPDDERFLYGAISFDFWYDTMG